MGRVVGIDLGTTFSAIALVNDEGKPDIIPNREGERITPSVVLFDGDTPIVGTIAKQSAVARPLNVVQFIKRQMGNPSWRFRTESGETFTPEEISAIILKRLKGDAEAALGEPVQDAVITVPAYFDDAQRKATHDAGRIAGLNVLRIINEPTAAALAYAFDSFRKTVAGEGAGTMRVEPREQTVLVYDLGGGTFDVTIMSLGKEGVNVIATGGDKNLGGFDWDNEIMKFLNNEFTTRTGATLYDDPELEQQLRDKAEVAKKTLSARDKASVLLAAGGKTASVVLTRADFEAMTASLFKRTASIMGFVLEGAGMQWPDVDKILLTGGSTRMTAVPALIERLTGQRPSSELHPDEVVALGAALQGTILELKETKRVGAKEKKRDSFALVRIQDINSHSMGVVALDENKKDANSIVLKKGTPIPCMVSDTFLTVVDNQTAIHVQVTEGEDTDLAYVKIVGEGTMQIPPYPRESPIEVHFEYDHDGIIHVRVFDLTGNAWLGELHIQRTSNLTEQDVQDKMVKLRHRDVG
ncbi:MAG: Hsp70 family protein [Planctomycetia bacterium]|nr:Hsp70 family protein [Planctomycetia bacterium]